MASATPDLQLPSQPQLIIDPWPVPNYTAWCANNLTKVVTWKRNGRDSNPRPFLSQIQSSNHYATRPLHMVNPKSDCWCDLVSVVRGNWTRLALFCCILGCLLFLICIEFVYLHFPVLFCLSVSVKWLAVETASEMTCTVSSGALNSTPTNWCDQNPQEDALLWHRKRRAFGSESKSGSGSVFKFSS